MLKLELVRTYVDINSSCCGPTVYIRTSYKHIYFVYNAKYCFAVSYRVGSDLNSANHYSARGIIGFTGTVYIRVLRGVILSEKQQLDILNT